MKPAAEQAEKRPAGERLVTLDVIRGVAVMGIFSVNVIAIAMIEPAYFNPAAAGFETVWDRIVWAANFVLIDGKMRGLFSILFGASMLLVIERARATGLSEAKTHFARMAVLLLVGAIHFYFIWWGDVLMLYAVVGMIAFLFRRLEPRSLILLALLLFAWIDVPRMLYAPTWWSEYAAAHSAHPTKQALETWAKRAQFFEPSAAAVAKDRAVHAHYPSYVADSLTQRRWEPWESFKTLWPETLALMLLGMAGFRAGFLTGNWSDRAYRRAAAIGVGIGGAAYVALAAITWRSGFRLPEVVAGYFSLSAPFRPVMALGYAAAIILLLRRPGAIRDRFAAVGRAAFTNYLGASILGAVAFIGFGLYGRLTRAEAWLLVPVVWLIMLGWSKPWLDRFSYGPFEWLWRSLARWQVQPLRKRLPPAASAAEA